MTYGVLDDSSLSIGYEFDTSKIIKPPPAIPVEAKATIGIRECCGFGVAGMFGKKGTIPIGQV
jgi:hypothetical protein